MDIKKETYLAHYVPNRTTVYFHYIDNSKFCIILNFSQSFFTDMTCFRPLYDYYLFHVAFGGIKTLRFGETQQVRNCKGSEVKSVLTKQSLHPLQSIFWSLAFQISLK